MEVLRNSFECSCCGQFDGACARYDDHYILIIQDHVSVVVTCTCVRMYVHIRTYLRAYVLLKAKVNWINLPDCARARKYSVAFSVKGCWWHPEDGSKPPQLGDHDIEFQSREDVLFPGWHSWRNPSDGSNSDFYTTALIGWAFWVESQMRSSFELTCQPPPVRCELLAQMGAYLDGSD